jgi:Fe-S oxidoreductase
MKVSLFITCLNDTLYPQTGIAMVKLLERLGCEIEFPRAQTCCGQMHLNTGYQPEALELIRNLVSVFEQAEIVVAPSGSCVAMIRELSVRAAEWSHDGNLLERVKNLASRTFELSEFLVNKLELEDVGAYYPHRVTYHPTCHAMRVLEVGDAPLKLLRNVRGLQLVPLEDANQCCGFGGTVGVVESEGNGRMCLTLPDVLISVMGIEKVLPELRDLEVMLQLLPRSSTAERMNPYTSLWTGVHRTPEGPNGVGLTDGPQEFHFVLLDNGRTQVLEDEVGRQALHCIRCSACLNVCPVYERTGGHSYGSVYPGPIGAILTPQLIGLETEHAQSLPFASSLCGACYEVCPVKINIPEILIHLRGEVVKHKAATSSPIKNFLNIEAIAMKTVAWTFSDHTRYELAQKAARIGQIPITKNNVISSLPGLLAGWTNTRDLPAVPAQSFREWWLEREKQHEKKHEKESKS